MQPTSLKHLTKNNTEATNKENVADILAETSTNSSLKNTNWQFLIFKHNAEKHNFNFESDNCEMYNKSFTYLTLLKLYKDYTTQQLAQMKSIMNSLDIYQENHWTTI